MCIEGEARDVAHVHAGALTASGHLRTPFARLRDNFLRSELHSNRVKGMVVVEVNFREFR
ncbi:hypothetical protein O9992_21800 [Vibrio lentus]|nr:hypothetical protein [Vibrio lentus]